VPRQTVSIQFRQSCLPIIIAVNWLNELKSTSYNGSHRKVSNASAPDVDYQLTTADSPDRPTLARGGVALGEAFFAVTPEISRGVDARAVSVAGVRQTLVGVGGAVATFESTRARYTPCGRVARCVWGLTVAQPRALRAPLTSGTSWKTRHVN